MPRRLRTLSLALALALPLSACGEEEPEVIDVGTRITTTADALECTDTATVETRSVAPTRRSGGADAATAVHTWAKRLRRSADIPLDGYAVSVEEVGTVLFTHETEGRAEIAVIAERTEDKEGDLGWVVSSWARCRPGQSGS
jgi:hypothetical protein